MSITQLTGTLVYVMVDKARPCFDKEKGEEYKCGIVLTDEDEVDAFTEEYPKQSVTKVKTANFEETYKCSPPEDAGKNVWVITLRKNTKLSNGKEVPEKYRPRVFEQVGNTKIDVTQTKLPGNGSKGSISIDRYEGEKGNIARLKNVLVTEMIEYERTESGPEYNPGDEFNDGKPVVAAKTETKKEEPKKPAAKKVVKKEEKEDEDSESPF